MNILPPIKIEAFQGLDNINSDIENPNNNTLSIAENVDVTRQNHLVNRNGYVKKYSGSIDSASINDIGILFIENFTLKLLSEDLATAKNIDTVSSSSTLKSIAANGVMYWSNNVEIGKIKAETNYPIAPQTPTNLPVITETVGDLSPGEYLITFTFEDELGVEGGSSRTQRITINSGGFTLSDIDIPTGLKLILYLSRPNGSTLFKALTIESSQTLAYRNNSLKLKYQLRNQYLLPMPHGHLMAFYRGHLLVASGETLYFSEPYNLGTYNPLKNFFTFSHKITNVAPVTSGVYISTEKEVIYMAGLSPTEWEYLEAIKYGVGVGLMTQIRGEYLKGNFAVNLMVVFPTEKGLFACDNSGVCYNLTLNSFYFPDFTQGTMLFREQNKQNHLLLIGR